MWLPWRTVMRSPSPEKYSFLPARSAKSKSLPKTKLSLWKTFITIGRLVVLTSSARSVPLALKCRCLALSGIANRLFSPHSKLRSAAVRELELRAAVPLEHVDDLFVEMALRRGRVAGRDLEHEHVGEVAAALQVHRRAVDAVARPRRGLHVEQVDAVILDERDALGLQPVEIGIDAETAASVPAADRGGNGGLRDSRCSCVPPSAGVAGRYADTLPSVIPGHRPLTQTAAT